MKIIKLFLIAAVLIGGIFGLMQLTSKSGGVEKPDVKSAQANMWKQRIAELCKEGQWTEKGYAEIESGIHSDRVTSKGRLLSIDEELSLKRYLFALSCSYLKDGADKLFKQSKYPKSTVEHYEGALDFLLAEAKGHEANGNLTEAANLFAAYRRLLGQFSFSSKATYSRPLRAFAGGSASGRKAAIKAMAYYKSHFSHNAEIKAKVDGLESALRQAEREYYSNLERCVERNYASTGDLATLLEDEMRFDEISTNDDAKERLDNFLKNN